MIRCSTSPEQNQVIQFVALKSRILGGHLFTIRKRSSEITEPPAWTSDLKRLIQNIFRALALCMIQQGVQRRNKCLSFIKLPVEFDRRWFCTIKWITTSRCHFLKSRRKNWTWIDIWNARLSRIWAEKSQGAEQRKGAEQGIRAGQRSRAEKRSAKNHNFNMDLQLNTSLRATFGVYSPATTASAPSGAPTRYMENFQLQVGCCLGAAVFRRKPRLLFRCRWPPLGSKKNLVNNGINEVVTSTGWISEPTVGNHNVLTEKMEWSVGSWIRLVISIKDLRWLKNRGISPKYVSRCSQTASGKISSVTFPLFLCFVQIAKRVEYPFHVDAWALLYHDSWYFTNW